MKKGQTKPNSVQGLKNKCNNKVDILCLSEDWLRANEIALCRLTDYKLVNSFCHNEYQRGGVCIFVKKIN